MGEEIAESLIRGSRLWTRDDTVKVKICNIESLEVAYEAACIGVHALGFHIFKSPGALSKAEKYKEIIEWLPLEISTVMVTRLDNINEIVEIVKIGGFDTVQIQISMEPNAIETLRTMCKKTIGSIHIIKTIWLGQADSMVKESIEQYSNVVDGFLFDSGSGEKGGTGKTHDWSTTRRLTSNLMIPFLLAGGINSENVEGAISTVRPFGVDVQSGVEQKLYNQNMESRTIKSVLKIRQLFDTTSKIHRFPQRSLDI